MHRLLATTLAATTSLACTASPCDGVNYNLTEARKATLAPAIAMQLHAPSVDVLQSFNIGRWSILYISAPNADNAFAFYSHDPVTSHYIAFWAGAATRDEVERTHDWILKNAPGIPTQLARCFVWHVAEAQDL